MRDATSSKSGLFESMVTWRRKRPYVELKTDRKRSCIPVTSKFQRFLALSCAFCFPAGAHVCYKMTSGIEIYLLERFSINSAEYGELNSAVSWAGLALIPFAAGYFVDTYPTRYSLLAFSLITLIGQLIFTIAVINGSFAGAVFGRAVFGLGESTVMIAQGTMCVQWFHGVDQLALAIGVTEMAHNIANYIGKVAINVGLAFGDWEMTLWFGVFICVFSCVISVAYFFLEASVETDLNSHLTDLTSTVEGNNASQPSCVSGCRDLFGARRLSGLFWLFCFLHFLVSNVEHLFDAISTDFIYEKWDMQWKEAAWLSGLNYALPILLSPVIGYMLDRSKSRMLIATMACITMMLGHFILGFLYWDPAVGMLVLAAAESVLPTILRSSIPLVVPPDVSGVTFGMFAVAENVGKVIGNPILGWMKDFTGDYILDEKLFVGMSFSAVLCCLVINSIDSSNHNLLKSKSSRAELLLLSNEAKQNRRQAAKPPLGLEDSEIGIAMTPPSSQV